MSHVSGAFELPSSFTHFTINILRPDWLEAATRHRRRPAQLVLGGVDTDSGAVFGGPAAHQS